MPALLALGFAVTASAADVAAPDTSLKAVVGALRHNDFKAVYEAMPAEQRAEAEKKWAEQTKVPDPAGDQQFDGTMAMLLAPNAADTLMAQLKPELDQLKPDELVAGLQQIGGFLAMAAQNQPKDPSSQGVDYAALQGFLADVAAWIPKAGINDPLKARQAIEHLIAGAKSLGIKTAADLHALSLADLIAKLSPATKEIKAALAVYDLNADALLDSITVAKIDGTGDQRTLSVQLTAFGHAHLIPVKMVKKDNGWDVAEGKDSPLAGLSQLVMLAMLSGGPAEAPVPAPAKGGQPPL